MRPNRGCLNGAASGITRGSACRESDCSPDLSPPSRALRLSIVAPACAILDGGAFVQAPFVVHVCSYEPFDVGEAVARASSAKLDLREFATLSKSAYLSSRTPQKFGNIDRSQQGRCPACGGRLRCGWHASKFQS